MVGLFGSKNPKAEESPQVLEQKKLDNGDNNKDDGEPTTTTTTNASQPRRREVSTATLPLSLHWMKAAAGLCCIECASSSAAAAASTTAMTTLQGAENNNDTTQQQDFYDWQALTQHKSAASPLVLAPMTSLSLSSSSNNDMSISNNNNNSNKNQQIQSILTEYMAACRFYGCADRINAGVLTTIRFSLPSLRVGSDFHDADMLALVEVLLRHINGALRFVRRLDFARTGQQGKQHGKYGFTSHGALALAKVLQMSEHIKEVWLPRNHVGPYGASALFLACSRNATIEKLVLRRCRIGERGARVFAEFVATSSECGLKEVDLSANRIGFRGTLAIEEALRRRNLKTENDDDDDLPAMQVDLEGNLVLQEILNGATHGLGTVLALVGSQLLSARVSGMSQRHVVSCGVFSASLLVLYLSSTLFHSFFTMRNTKWIFQVMDKCAIYILIAGSYTPYLQITLPHEPIYSEWLLAFLWVCCVLGIGVEAFFPIWKYKTVFSLIMYLSMGWSALVCLPEVAAVAPARAMNLVILGGVAYTVGVPFFVRNNNLDHTIWHMFVLSGSIFHWCSIYFYVTELTIPPLPSE